MLPNGNDMFTSVDEITGIDNDNITDRAVEYDSSAHDRRTIVVKRLTDKRDER